MKINLKQRDQRCKIQYTKFQQEAIKGHQQIKAGSNKKTTEKKTEEEPQKQLEWKQRERLNTEKIEINRQHHMKASLLKSKWREASTDVMWRQQLKPRSLAAALWSYQRQGPDLCFVQNRKERHESRLDQISVNNFMPVLPISASRQIWGQSACFSCWLASMLLTEILTWFWFKHLN